MATASRIMPRHVARSDQRGDCARALAELVEGARHLGLELGPAAQETFARYCQALSDANTRFNLTAVQSPGGIMRTLFLDSLTAVPALPPWLKERNRESRVVDVGAGAGIPGLPLKIVFPWWELALVESVGKKARFLEATVTELGLAGVTVVPRRTEELGGERGWRDAADLCLARAVAPLPTLLEYCAPLVRAGGLLALPKSGEVAEEVAAAEAAARALRVRLRDIVPVSAALNLGEHRAIVVYDKVGATPAGYPRRTGLARSRPIGSQGNPSTADRSRGAAGRAQSSGLPDPGSD